MDAEMNGKGKSPALWPRLSKEEINQYPIRKYYGEVKIVRTENELTRAMEQLANETLLGFDTETRPAFTRGESYPPSLLQLAGASGVFLFQLTRSACPPPSSPSSPTPESSRRASLSTMTSANWRKWRRSSRRALSISAISPRNPAS